MMDRAALQCSTVHGTDYLVASPAAQCVSVHT